MYSNPLSGVGGTQNRYQITPTSQHPPPLPPYFATTGAGDMAARNIHIHYPTQRHAVSEYQAGLSATRCANNNRACNSCDALASPMQPPPLPPPVEGWYQPVGHPHGNQMQPTASSHQIYQCSSECSDNSRASHSHSKRHHQQQLHSDSSTEHSSSKRSAHRRQQGQQLAQHQQQLQQQNSCAESENENMLPGYERQQQPQRNYTSDCGCNSSREGDTCSCSEGSCLYAEAGDPMGPAPRLMTAKNT